jgi:hypothetical protein
MSRDETGWTLGLHLAFYFFFYIFIFSRGLLQCARLPRFFFPFFFAGFFFGFFDFILATD